ncbi:MAG: hypothetical protein IJC43_04900, partial [Clostridia bacterium]|nr:hypothetical protein [Clostridia bacterium]
TIPLGFEVSATNVGNCSVNLTFLGYAIKKNNQFYFLFPTKRDLNYKGILSPTEIKSVYYTPSELRDMLLNEDSNTPLYVYAVDSSNERYKRESGTVGNMLNALERMESFG